MNRGQMTREDRSALLHFWRQGQWEFTRTLTAVRSLICASCSGGIQSGETVVMLGNPRQPHCDRCIPKHPRGEQPAKCDLCDGVPVVNEHEAIVKELAERGPRFDDYSLCAECVEHGHELYWSMQATTDSMLHAPRCLWRRAKALYPEPGA